MSDVPHAENAPVYNPPARVSEGSHVASMDSYREMYRRVRVTRLILGCCGCCCAVAPLFRASTPFLDVRSAALCICSQSIEDGDAFWTEQANAILTWDRPFGKVSGGGFHAGDVHWFVGGKLNVSVNCLDRHLETKADQVRVGCGPCGWA